ncbi:hypothetical protein DSO57_1000864 [Entomophthora muscae]|uniref:Uncharacterized protein n=1 Tax=Entomophthora muscae TaxID=34485 RepID=A0ACC2U7S5_9FUNG|nr:hypothetical protein DSO57_1000864 [Entomophthora muscae]
MAIVFLGVARPKRRHPGKPDPKPCPLVVIIDLNLMIDHKWVVAQEIGSEWGADAPHPIFPSLTCWSKILTSKEVRRPPHQDAPKGFKFVITRLLDSAFSPLQFPGNLSPPAEMIPETREIECEPIYAADSLTLSQMKVFLMYLCIIFCCTFPYSLFKGYHLRVNTHCLLLIGNVILIWVYIPHLINYNELSLYFTLTLSNYSNFDILYGLHIFVVRSFSCIMNISVVTSTMLITSFWSIFVVVFFPLLYPYFAKIEIMQPCYTLLSCLKFWQPAPSLPFPLLTTAREILALTEK